GRQGFDDGLPQGRRIDEDGCDYRREAGASACERAQDFLCGFQVARLLTSAGKANVFDKRRAEPNLFGLCRCGKTTAWKRTFSKGRGRGELVRALPKAGRRFYKSERKTAGNRSRP